MLHTYLSMVSFSILLFFAVTGITLNHQGAFNADAKTTRFTGQLESSWLQPPAGREVARSEIVGALRSTHGIDAAVKDFRVEENEITITFKGPGYAADGFIDRQKGTYDITESRLGLIAVINDLHKGRDTGSAWAWVIDISAGLMVLVSLTGLTLIFFLQKRRTAGLIALAMGTAVCVAVYALWVS
ncbi:MAG: PepSY-associated TM helix domain-containing protein [Vicinamibacterales bacterium]